MVNGSFAFYGPNGRMTELSDDIKDAKRRQRPWAETAASVRERLRKAGERASVKSGTLAQAAELSGYSPPTLFRQLILLAALEEVSPLTNTQVAELVKFPFSVLELSCQIYRRDQMAGLDAFRSVAEGTAEVKTLRKKLDTLPMGSGRSEASDAVARRRHERRNRVLANLKSLIPDLQPRPKDWGEQEALRRFLESPPICRFTWWRRRGVEDRLYPNALEGFDLMYAPSGSTAKWLDDRLSRVLVSASFFDLYWIVLPEPSPLIRAIKAATALPKRPEIGVLTMATDGSFSEEQHARHVYHSSEERRALIRDFAPDRPQKKP